MENYKTDPNAPANPVKHQEFFELNGCTKRELFAAMALSGLSGRDYTHLSHLRTGEIEKHIAGSALEIADALIDALNKTRTDAAEF
jgi:hypothetical protein